MIKIEILLYFPNRFQVPENRKVLLWEIFPCRKYTWNRAVTVNVTVVFHCRNQFQRLEKKKKKTETFNFQLHFAFSSKFLELEMGCCYIRFYTGDSRPWTEYLLKLSLIFHISQISFETHVTVDNLIKMFGLDASFIFVAIFNA